MAMRFLKYATFASAISLAAALVCIVWYKEWSNGKSTIAGVYNANIWQCACRDDADLIIVDAKAYLYIPHHGSLRPFGDVTADQWLVPQGFVFTVDARNGGVWLREATHSKSVFLRRKTVEYDFATVLATTEPKDVTKYLKPGFFLATLDRTED